MIRTIQLRNFKQFEQFSVHCRDVNILVGPNNAGKSTTLDALRICADVLRFAARRNPTPESVEGQGVCASYHLSHSIIGIGLRNIVRNYGDESAAIEITHQNGNKLLILAHHDHSVKAHLKTTGSIPRNTAQFKKQFPLNISVVPTLGPLEEQERFVGDETVRTNENTRLAHRSFRNILYRKTPDEFAAFSDLVKAAWPGIDLGKPELSYSAEPVVEMFFRENLNVREVYWSGFGFQVWMQMMLQVMRGGSDTVLVMDEPDIYLHPELQRRLVKTVQARFSQTFIATHSTEIINEVGSGDVLLVNSNNRSAQRITSDDGYRKLFSYLGSSENAEFARMARAKRVVFFEGKDRSLLRKISVKVNSGTLLDDPGTVFLQAGGFGQWRRVKEVGWTLDNVFSLDVKVAALFDRDYRCEEEIDQFKSQINSPSIRCHVLKRKEIENYVLKREPIIRAVQQRIMAKEVSASVNQAEDLIERAFDDFHDETRAQIIGSYISFKKRVSPRVNEATLSRDILNQFDSLWATWDGRLSIVPGKDFISTLSARLQQKYGTSITINQLITEMQPREVDAELVEIIDDFDRFFAE